MVEYGLIKFEEVRMISVSIPGWGDLDIEYLVIDYNGTVAFDGKPKDGVKELMEKISRYIKLFIITADTYGNIDNEGTAVGFRIIKVGKRGKRQGKSTHHQRAWP